MGTLTYDFEADTIGTVPDGWNVLAYTGSNDTQVEAGKVFRIGTASGSAICNCTDAPTGITDVDVTTSFKRNVAATSASIALKITGTTSANWVGYQIKSNNVQFAIQKVDRVTNPDLDSVATVTTPGTWYKMRAEITGTTIRAKVWLATDPEPGTWALSTTDSTYTSGMTCLNVGDIAFYDDISITADEISTDIPQGNAGSLTVTGYDATVNIPTNVYVGSPVTDDETGGWAVIRGYDVNTLTITNTLGEVSITGYDPRLDVRVGNAGGVTVSKFNSTVVAVASTTPKLFIKWKDGSGNVREREITNRVLVSTATSAYTAKILEEIVLADATAGAFSVTLPTASGRTGYIYRVKKTDSSANAVTVDGNGAETIDGDTTIDLLSQNEAISVVSDGADWHVLNRLKAGLLYAVPSAVTLNTGTRTAGDVDSFATALDGDTYDVDEAAGAPGFDIELDFTGIDRFDELRIRKAYSGLSTHLVDVLLYNYDTSSYDTLTRLLGSEGDYIWFVVPVPDSSAYISSGAVNAKIYHTTSGNASHDVSIDYVALVSRVSTV